MSKHDFTFMSSSVYYYKANTEDPSYKNREKIEQVIRELAKPYKTKVEQALGRSINIQYWSKRTFGCIFSDFKEGKYHKNGSGEKILFENLQNRFKVVVFSENLGEEYSDKKPIDDGEIFILNFPKFQKLVSIAKKEELVKIFVNRSEQKEIEFDNLLEEYRKSGKIYEYLKLEDIKTFVENNPPEKIEELKQAVPAFRQLVDFYDITPQNLTTIINGIIQFSKNNRISPENFSKITEILKTNLSDRYDLEPESFSKMVDMMGLLSKQYKIKTVEELEKLLDFVIDFFEKHEVTKPTDFQRIMNIVLKLTPKYEIKDPSDLKKILELCRMSDNIIKSNPTYFREQLKKFKGLIDDPGTLENDVHKAIAKDPWLLDFKYWAYPIIESPKKITADDILDLYLEKSNFKTKYAVLVEFKKPDEVLTLDNYRKNKPVIAPEVGKALSQLINYKEKLKHEPYTIVDSLVVIGKRTKESDFFIEVFSRYLHDVEIATYDGLYDKALNVVDAFDSAS